MPRNSRGREADGDPHPPDRRPLRLVGSSSDSLLERDGFEATIPCARRLFRWTEYRAEARRSGLETMIVSRGTDSSNPSSSSGESCKPSVPRRVGPVPEPHLLVERLPDALNHTAVDSA